MNVSWITVLDQMAALFCLLLLGYTLNRLGLFPRETEIVISRMVTYVLLPALNMYTFMMECTWENVRAYGSWILYGSVFMLLSIALAAAVSRFLAGNDLYRRRLYSYALSFPNTGGIGTPLVQELFGTVGLFQYFVFLLVNGIVIYAWGVTRLMPKEESRSLSARMKQIFNPVSKGILIGAFLGLTGLTRHLPEIVPNTIRSVGNCYAVMTMLLTGFVIGDYSIRDVIGEKRTYAVGALRLLAIPCLFLVFLKGVGASRMLMAMVCLTYACPCGMNLVIYPASYGEDTKPGASMVLLTSAMSVATIPCILALI